MTPDPRRRRVRLRILRELEREGSLPTDSDELPPGVHSIGEIVDGLLSALEPQS